MKAFQLAAASSVPVIETDTDAWKQQLKRVDRVIRTFDDFFIDICPIDLYNNPNKGEDVKFSANLFTDKQLMHAKELSGLIIALRESCKSKIPSVVLYSGPDDEKPKEDPVLTPQQEIEQLKRKLLLSRDMLIREMAENEKYIMDTRAMEEDIVKLAVERDEMKKKAEKLNQKISNMETASNGSRPARENNSVKVEIPDKYDPLDFIGLYIRKRFGDKFFFGLIVGYDKPYFQVVYEDTDFEEYNISELMKFLWKDKVPKLKIQAMEDHVKTSTAINAAAKKKYFAITKARAEGAVAPGAVSAATATSAGGTAATSAAATSSSSSSSSSSSLASEPPVDVSMPSSSSSSKKPVQEERGGKDKESSSKKTLPFEPIFAADGSDGDQASVSAVSVAASSMSGTAAKQKLSTVALKSGAATTTSLSSPAFDTAKPAKPASISAAMRKAAAFITSSSSLSEAHVSSSSTTSAAAASGESGEEEVEVEFVGYTSPTKGSKRALSSASSNESLPQAKKSVK